MTIPPRLRLGLLLKGLLLASLGLGFFTLAIAGLRADWSLPARLAFAIVFGALGLFPSSVCRLALLDAFLGRAVEVRGAVALDERQRRAGYSLRLPDGHFAEFLVRNPWAPLVPGASYSVIIGVHSRVIVAPPQRATETRSG
ncbi:MAG: hypothetical protein JNJ54_31400 [Myxococcaceae bacterium]|nr:hypothetical protein [Myxococcaceae bacterium]